MSQGHDGGDGRGGVDTATKVLSLPAVDADADTDAEEAPGAATRTRTGAGSAKAETPVKAEAPVEADTPAKAEAPVEADTPVKAEAPAKAEETAGKSAASPESPSEGARKPEDAPGEDAGEDARLRAAVAAWVGSAKSTGAAETAEGPAADAEDAEDSAEHASEEAETPEDPEGAGKAEQAGADAEDVPDADADAAPVSLPEAEADAEAAADADEAEAEPEAETDAKPEPEAKPEAKADVKPKPETKPEAKADAKPKAEPESKPARDAADEGADADAAGDDDSKPEPESKPEPDLESKAAADAPADAPSEPFVDQPTAIFRAPRPAVDQPTTMLKLGGGKVGKSDEAVKSDKQDKKPTNLKDPRDPSAPQDGDQDAEAGDGKNPSPASKASAPAPAPAPESEVERTSKFIALKSLDAPPAGKASGAAAAEAPAPAAPAPAPDKAAPAADKAAPAADKPASVGPERTTQQPLPPKPPLDLLAELTNTPPPPETPLRTTWRRVKIWTPLVLLLAIVLAVVQALRPLPSPAVALTAKQSYDFAGAQVSLPWPGEGQGWMDVDGIGTMGRFGKQTPVAIGSVAKTMTSYIVLRDHPLKPGQEGPKIKVDATAEKEGGYDKSGESTLNTVKAGDFLTEKQALSAVMIPSANNIARLLARWDAGSETAFVKKMNAAARDLGMTGTTYTDPSGLKESTVSTAQDQVKLGDGVVKLPALVAITGAASWRDPSGHGWQNYNSLPFTIGAIGIKTGTTTAAGGNLLFAARKQVGGRTVTVVGAILGQHKGPSILDTVNAVSKTALVAARNALTSETILKKGDVVGYVDDQLGGRTPVVLTKDLPAVGWAGLKAKLSFSAHDVPHTAKAGTEVGTLTVGDGDRGAVQAPVVLQKDLAEPGFADKLTRLG
ncbi:D-alanyl-D-alanine carboxypeptidase [Streptomyces sp. NPDC046985]|uniref:D-alanyl-D-alanine carboxypeptidase n=1 Tax=Streptomyces sp. NPDC046985 TaxID=3155377 RepID=UPI0033CDEFC4